MAKPRPVEPVTVDDAIDRFEAWLVNKSTRNQGVKPTPATISTYLRDVTEMRDRVGGGQRQLDDIELSDLELALTALAKAPDRRYTARVAPARRGGQSTGRNAHSRARWVASVRAFFRWAEQAHVVTINPADGLAIAAPPKRAGKHRAGLPVDDAALLRETPTIVGPPAHVPVDASLRDQVILWLLTETGPRVSELVARDVNDFSTITYRDAGQRRTGSILTIRRGKGGKERILPVTEQLAGMIGDYLRERVAPEDETALFVSVRGRRLSARDIQRLTHKYAQIAGTQPVTPHGLRHTAVTALVNGGASVAAVMDIAGHDNLATTSIYLDRSVENVFDALNPSPLSHQLTGAAFFRGR